MNWKRKISRGTEWLIGSAVIQTTNIQHPTSNIQWPGLRQYNWLFDVGCWMLDVYPSSSRKSFPPAYSPLGHKASQDQQKNNRLVPQRIRPRFGDRRVAFRKMAHKFFQILQRHDFSAGAFCDGFQPRAI